MIRDGFSTDLDELRNAQRGGKDWLAKLQQDEIERTGISSLKVRFNPSSAITSKSPGRTSTKFPALHPQTDRRERRAFHHARVEGHGGKILGAKNAA